MATQIPSSPPLPSLHDPPSPTSSEPPLFSSDDPLDNEEAINYISPRFKRKRTGPWWEAEPGETTQTIPKKSKLSRNFDSGVWLPSDESDEADNPPLQIQKKEEKMDPVEFDLIGQVALQMNNSSNNGQTIFNFEEMELRDEHVHHLEALGQLVVAVSSDALLPSEGQFRSMIPELVLNLSRNRLQYIGPTLFQLDAMHSLNLSGNNIEELPPAIGNLRNLRSLNLSQNRLRWLPKEILGLLRPEGRLFSMSVVGNLLPGFNLPRVYDSSDNVYRDTCQSSFGIEFRGSTPVSYYDTYGNLVKGSPALPLLDENSLWGTKIDLEADDAENFAPSGSKTQSLLSLSMRASLQELTIPEIEAMLDHDVPPSVKFLLQKARENMTRIHSPMRRCTICSGPFVVPRTEWMECWTWALFGHQAIRGQGCSWACIPGDRKKETV